MSWLSTFVHNNSGLVTSAGNALGLAVGVPGLGSTVNTVFGGSPPPPSLTPGVKPSTLMQLPSLTLPQGLQNPRPTTPPITRDSTGIRIGTKSIPLLDMTTVKNYGTPARQQQTSQGSGVVGAICGKGYHLAKTKHLRAAGVCVRNRHMNPGNGHAVKRAVRRLRAFHKLAVRVERSLHLGRASSRGRSRAPVARSCGCR